MPESDTFLAHLGMFGYTSKTLIQPLLLLILLCEHILFEDGKFSCLLTCFSLKFLQLSPEDTTYPDKPEKYQMLTSGLNSKTCENPNAHLILTVTMYDI